MQGFIRKLVAKARSLGRANGGGVAIIFALTLPGIAVVSLGGMEYATVVADNAKLQGIADSAALAAAKQLGIDASSATALRAEELVKSQLANLIGTWSLNVTAAVVDQGRAVTITITGSRPSMFGDLLPPGGWKLVANSEAQIEGLMPLCVLGIGGSNAGSGSVIDMQSVSRITATGCMIHSNSDITAENSSVISAGAVEAVGDASGSIAPSPQSGAPAIVDPFVSAALSAPSGCTTNAQDIPSGTTVLPAGVHCGPINVSNNATLELAPGEHYFVGCALTLKNKAILTGTDVALIFDATSSFAFKHHSDIELEGRKTGPLAGFVIATTRDNVNTFEISTTSAHKLLGVVYIPAGLLAVSGSGQVAETSAWTVVVAKAMQVTGSANLVMNVGYAAAAVPVPSGVGNSSANAFVSLVH